MTATSPVVHSDPNILGGEPVFMGTRVPVRTLIDYLEAGDAGCSKQSAGGRSATDAVGACVFGFDQAR